MGRLPSELLTGRRGPLKACEETLLRAYYAQTPWGDERIEAQLAQLSHLIHSANSPKEKRRPMSDFLLFRRRATKPKRKNLTDTDNQVLAVFSKLLPPKK